MISVQAKVDDLDVEFTPIPPFLLVPEIPAKESAQLCAIDRATFLEVHYKGQHVDNRVYEIVIDGKKTYAKVAACTLAGKPGNVMILGATMEKVDTAWQKMKKKADR